MHPRSEAKELQWNTDGARHLVMRLGLGLVLVWFGVQELNNPGDWAVFVPSFVASVSPVSINNLILIHGFLLLLAAGAIVFGLFYTAGCLLALLLIAQIIFGLWWDDGVSDLVVRDVGLLALAGALLLDRGRFWHVDNVFAAADIARPSNLRDRKGSRSAAPRRWTWLRRAGAGGALLAIVFALAIVLEATGSSESGLPDRSVVALSDSAPPAPSPSPVKSAAAANPAAAGTPSLAPVRFQDWRFRQYSFQVYPGDISSDARRALAGFDLSIRDQGDKVLLYLKALSSRYKDSQQLIDKANTAYFVETTMRDDPNDQENNLGDDGIVVVTPDGYIKQS